MVTATEPPAQSITASSPEAEYRERCRVYGEQRDTFARRSDRISNVRLLVFGIAALLFIIFVSGGEGIYLAGAVLFLAAFLALAVYHERVVQRQQRFAELWAINDEALKRLECRWNDLPERPFTAPPAEHAYANDLDLFGHASLFKLLDVTSTSFGSTTLQRWLLAPATPAVILQRQAAVSELAQLIDLREEVIVRGRLMGAKKPDAEAFLSWAEEEPWLLRRPLLLWATRVLPPITWLAMLASATNVSPYPVWLVLLAINLAVLALAAAKVEKTLGAIYSSARAFQFYTQLFEILSTAEFSAPELRRLQQRLTVAGLQAHRQMARLASIAGTAITASSALYLPIQLVSFWNVHVLYFLELWKVKSGGHAREWLDVLGDFEALVALAGLAHAHPDWAYPALQEAAPRNYKVEAIALGHPLLAASARVDNDVTVGPPGTFLLVTGSNMSGKSTLLRALGTNIVLAQTGSVVCANRFSLPPLELYTSIRIQDSLEQGISLFMAELLRLKQIVDAADRVEQEGDRTLFYLLDEILHGTNTAERQIAARRILRHLLAQGAIGSVSSHDLQLADTPELAGARRDAHFTETFRDDPAGPTMEFDYQLRPGLATSTNALKLMRIAGLDLD